MNDLPAKDRVEVSDLQRMDTKQITLNSDTILCFLVVKNENIRLPFFLKYYRKQGISNFFIVDNNSTDNTLNYLLQQPDVYVWHTKKSFRENKQKWINSLLHQYGQKYWCLILDADEIFYYPDCEYKTIPELCYQLEQQKKDALQIIMLDMYSDKPIEETQYTPGHNFLEVCPYFDKHFYHYREGIRKNYYWGGLRQRVFSSSDNKTNKKLYCLTKFPLIKYNSNLKLVLGLHYLKNAKVSSTTGCLLHFKYFSFFVNKVREAIQENQYWQNSQEYRKYAHIFQKNNHYTFYIRDKSVKLESSEQLIRMGIMSQGSLRVKSPYLLPFFELIYDLKNQAHSLFQFLFDRISK